MDTATNEFRINIIETSEDSRQRSERTQTFQYRKIRVLVIDDSAIVRQLVRAGI